jgi:serine/threonine-protein kinase
MPAPAGVVECDGEGAATSDRPITADVPVILYEVRTTQDQSLGPLSYAELVQALAMGRVGPDDRVREGGGAFEVVSQIRVLRRHLPPSTMTPTTRRRDAPGKADELIPLAYGGAVAAVAWSALRKDTGLWLCEAGGVRKELYVKDGVPEFVTSNVASELLGEYLVAHGVISRGELDMALAVMPRFEGKLGDTLAALGLVEPVHLFQHIGNQVREKLLDLFTWNAGQAELYRGVPPPDISFPLGLDAWAILDEGIRRRIELGLEDDRFDGRDEHSLQQVMDVPREVNRAPFPPLVRRILATLHRPTSLTELESTFDDPDGKDLLRTRRVLVLLFHVHAIEWTP